MRFLRDRSIEKTIIVISDTHLGAGAYVRGRKNLLEDFFYDAELVDLLDYYSTGSFANRYVELVINGDFVDLLAVPFVNFFDDEFWSEEASIEKLKLVHEAHKEVFTGLEQFLVQKNKKITYIIGNHDAELILPRVKNSFMDFFSQEVRENIQIICNEDSGYFPSKGICIKHGHEYEVANSFQPKDSVIVDKEGRRFFLPSWGHYYVTRIINKFKEERPYIHSVRPIRKFIINGLIYDAFFTMRFLVANIVYFVMVRFIYFFKQERRIRSTFINAKKELNFFLDTEEVIRDTLEDSDEINTLIVGHTHRPEYTSTGSGKVFINTGTWTKMHDLDFGKRREGIALTYAKVDILEEKKTMNHNVEEGLFVWKGRDRAPFVEFI